MNKPMINKWCFDVNDDFETALEDENNDKKTLDNFAGLPSEVYLLTNWWTQTYHKINIKNNATCRDVITKVLEFYKDAVVDNGNHTFFEGFYYDDKEHCVKVYLGS